MKNKLKIAFAVLVLVLTSLACAIPGFSGCTPDEGTLFSDDFSDDSCGWEHTYRDADGISDYDQDGFRLQVNQANYDYWANPGVNFTDTIITADATKIGGPDDNDFGLLCRYVDDLNYYFFLISSDGYYVIGKAVNGESTPLTGEFWGQSEHILQGNATNSIQADCIGNTLRLVVNGNVVHQVNDSDLSSGDVGIIAGTFDIPGTDILFDNFVVRSP